MAGRFRFRLEVVRRLREQARDAQRRVVGNAARAVTAVQDRIADLNAQLRDTIDETRAMQREKRPDVVPLRGHLFYRGRLHRRILESDAELTNRQAELDRERARLAETSKRLKVIEKLRERYWTRYLAQVAREEQAAYDETAVQRYIRSRCDADLEVPRP